MNPQRDATNRSIKKLSAFSTVYAKISRSRPRCFRSRESDTRASPRICNKPTLRFSDFDPTFIRRVLSTWGQPLDLENRTSSMLTLFVNLLWPSARLRRHLSNSCSLAWNSVAFIRCVSWTVAFECSTWTSFILISRRPSQTEIKAPKIFWLQTRSSAAGKKATRKTINLGLKKLRSFTPICITRIASWCENSPQLNRCHRHVLPSPSYGASFS